jgi:hypothetical protein
LRKPPKSLSRRRNCGARKDLAVYASLSSNQIVKEPANPEGSYAAQPIDLLSRPQQGRRSDRFA